MNKSKWMRYWLYYTVADLIGIFTGMVIYGIIVFPTEYLDMFRVPPGTLHLASASGSIFYFWYIKGLYLPLLLASFFFFLKSIRRKREYYTSHRIIILLLYLGILPTVDNIQDGHQFFIPVCCVIFFNVIAFYLLESRERHLI